MNSQYADSKKGGKYAILTSASSISASTRLSGACDLHCDTLLEQAHRNVEYANARKGMRVGHAHIRMQSFPDRPQLSYSADVES
eukprot:3947718-Amphidinium_carterae.1